MTLKGVVGGFGVSAEPGRVLHPSGTRPDSESGLAAAGHHRVWQFAFAHHGAGPGNQPAAQHRGLAVLRGLHLHRRPADLRPEPARRSCRSSRSTAWC
ncbi:MAG: hypothetical protein WKG07_11455 [Hymenobacter sp.]